ncbi:hypothetical protein SAMN05444172_9038 [Burkholderia sp. GAS332]|nr:hypothetical protein SAMN05444172_9038 [Burkholderia sp. GAS332]
MSSRYLYGRAIKPDYPHLATRLFNVPLAITPEKIAVIMAALADRFGLAQLCHPGGEVVMLDVEFDAGGSAQERAYEVVEGLAVLGWGTSPCYTMSKKALQNPASDVTVHADGSADVVAMFSTSRCAESSLALTGAPVTRTRMPLCIYVHSDTTHRGDRKRPEDHRTPQSLRLLLLETARLARSLARAASRQ